MRSDHIVPFAMKFIRLKIDRLHVVLRDCPAGGILAAIQSAGYCQSFRGRGLGNEIDDGFVITQGLATPIRRDERKEAVLDLVPLAGPRRKVTDRNRQAGVIRECLEFQFPQT